MIMARKIRQTIFVCAAGLFLAGCVSDQELAGYSAKEAGFSVVAASVSRGTGGKDTVWIQNTDQARAVSARVHALVHKKTINADTAVQVALLNNKGLQSAYADIGMTAAEVWQQGLPENPKVSIGLLGIGAPELAAYRAIEGMIAANILSLATRRARMDIADTRFRQAQMRAVDVTLKVANDARRAWVNAVSAFETVAYLNQAKVAADAASELAQKLGETGALPKSGQAREHAFYAELTGQMAEARLAARLAKEELTRIMGLWGSEVDYYVPDKLPSLPRSIIRKNRIEQEALENRVDLRVAKLELEAVAKSYGLTKATRFVTDLEIISGVEAEREIETEYEIVGANLEETKTRKTVVTPQLELEFVIPIFDSGKPKLRKAELAYMQAANLLAEKAVNIRSEARSAYTAYRSTHEIARHYRNAVVPLRSIIEQESLLTYNGMITNTFELLADTRAKVGTLLLAVNAKRAFWLADVNLSAAIYGGGAAAGGGAFAPSVGDAGGAGH
ncbi:MAG: copper resistance protein [Phyllobacteriaceae bacterium]|nr:copper resistance protein [Phyllobacteriaceae bacterium]MBA93031.1 copper resistance protein [Phyllobacteriaceae bacterium]